MYSVIFIENIKHSVSSTIKLTQHKNLAIWRFNKSQHIPILLIINKLKTNRIFSLFNYYANFILYKNNY